MPGQNLVVVTNQTEGECHAHGRGALSLSAQALSWSAWWITGAGGIQTLKNDGKEHMVAGMNPIVSTRLWNSKMCHLLVSWENPSRTGDISPHRAGRHVSEADPGAWGYDF